MFTSDVTHFFTSGLKLFISFAADVKCKPTHLYNRHLNRESCMIATHFTLTCHVFLDVLTVTSHIQPKEGGRGVLDVLTVTSHIQPEGDASQLPSAFSVHS